MRDHTLYLKDIIEAMEAIEKFVEGLDIDEFQKNDMISSAVIRKFEIIGEAAKNIPDTVRSKYPEIPWKGDGWNAGHAYPLLFWGQIRSRMAYD